MLTHRVVPQPLDPADEMGGDPLEGGDVGGAVEVEVGPGGRGGVGAEDEGGGVLVRRRGRRPVADQGLQGAA